MIIETMKLENSHYISVLYSIISTAVYITAGFQCILCTTYYNGNETLLIIKVCKGKRWNSNYLSINSLCGLVPSENIPQRWCPRQNSLHLSLSMHPLLTRSSPRPLLAPPSCMYSFILSFHLKIGLPLLLGPAISLNMQTQPITTITTTTMLPLLPL